MQLLPHLFNVGEEALFQLVRIAAQHVAGSGLLLQDARADANALLPQVQCLVLQHRFGFVDAARVNVPHPQKQQSRK